MTKRPDEHLTVGVSIGVDREGAEQLVFVSGDSGFLLLSMEKADWLCGQLQQRMKELSYERKHRPDKQVSGD